MPVKDVKKDKDGIPPKFVKELENQDAIAGKPAILSVEIEGQPEPIVEWTVDDEEIFEDQGISFKQEGKVYSLVFTETVEEDEGLYACNAKNELGEASCTATLSIVEESIKPEFIQKMKHVEATEGHEAEFIVEVDGTPLPEIRWLKKKEVLEESEKYRLLIEEGRHVLVITDCDQKDAGVFQAVAENSAGKVSCNAQLTVVKKAEPPRIETFEDYQSEIVAKEGERLSVEFVICADECEKCLKKDGKKLEENKGIEFIEDKKKAAVVIDSAKEEDAGEYEVIVTNESGEDKLNFTVKIEGQFSFF